MALGPTDYVSELEKMQLVLHSWSTTVVRNKYTESLLAGISDLAVEATILLSVATAKLDAEDEPAPEVTVVDNTPDKYNGLVARYVEIKKVVDSIQAPQRVLKRTASDVVQEQPQDVGDGVDEETQAASSKQPQDVDEAAVVDPKRVRLSAADGQGSESGAAFSSDTWANTYAQPW